MPRVCQRCNHSNADEARFCLQCGNLLEVEAEDSSDPLIGKVLMNRYRVSHLLGEGGMGKVYLSEQKMGTATRNVAIKTLHPELGNDAQLVARFHRECETVVELSHPNTVQFYDFGDLDDGTLFIVMEFIEGESLAHVLQRGAIEPGRADRIMIQICGSLHEAHQRGVVHRDLKPENVLLTERGGQTDFVKVLDFGIAKRSEAEDESQQKLTKQGMVLGTPPYMSPEQFSGQALDARSDIYSLGVMAYEMLTGQLPFEAATPWEWATKHLTAQPTPFEAQGAGAQVPEQKRHAVMRALAKNRDERFSTVLEFMHAFTGMQDAQQAWTLATTPGGMAAAQSQGEPRAPVGTPQPMPQSGGHPQAGYQTPQTRSGDVGLQQPGWGTGEEVALPKKGGAGKLVAIAVIALFVLGGAAAGGLWFFMQQDGGDALAAGPEQGTNATGTEGEQDAPNVPSTPPEPVEDEGEGDEQDGAEGSEDEEQAAADDEGDDDEAAREAAREAQRRREAAKRREARERAARERESAGGGGGSGGGGARVDALVAEAKAALGRNDIKGAISALRKAEQAGGGAAVRQVQGDLARRASNQVGILLQSGKCPEAQALYRQLRSVSAHRPSAQHFGDWCARP